MNFYRFKENLTISTDIINNLRIKSSSREIKLFTLDKDYKICPCDLTSSEIINMLKNTLGHEIEYEHFFPQNFKLFNVKDEYTQGINFSSPKN
jgi:hypothetical protein